MNGSLESFNRSAGYRSTFPVHTRVIHDAIEPAEMFHGEIHERFGLSRTRSVCAVKRHLLAEFLFECFSFFFRATAEYYVSAFLNKAPDDACSDPSGSACNNSDLIFQSEPG